MAASGVQSLWDAAFSEKKRPELYTSDNLNEDGFRPLADPLEFVTDVSKLSASQLYAQSANNSEALVQAQTEYLELEKLVNHLKSKDPTAVPTAKNPQTFPAPTEFEERKESTLYSYKYDANRPLASYGRWQDATEVERRDLRSYQDPFAQGGFVPNDRQYKGLMNRAKDKRNPDNWTPVEKDGKRLIPKMAPRVNEKEEYWQLSGLLTMTKTISSKPVTRSGTPDVGEDTGGRGTPVNKRLRNTRFNGAKVPLTRDVSEAPSLPASRASTPKRKRGDTPLLTHEPNGSPIKRPRVAVATTEIPLPPRRKHHNQYTKAREKAALEALTTPKAHGGPSKDIRMQDVVGVANKNPIPRDNLPIRPWSGLTAEEMRAYHWNNDTLKQAVADDYTWLTTELNVSAEWRDKILASTYPVRTHSMFKKWREWRENGEDKRPRNRQKPGVSSGGRALDTGSEVVTATSSPVGRTFITLHGDLIDFDDDDEPLSRASRGSQATSRLSRSLNLSQSSHDMDDDDFENSQHSHRSSNSNSSSQTINVNQDLPITTTSRRTTRAARKTST